MTLLALACAEPPLAHEDPCPGGSWGGDAVPAGAVLVPDDYATIGDALASAGEGGTVAVSEGTYVENLSPPAGVELVGQCAELVTVDGSAEEAPTIEVSDGASLSGLTITGGYRGLRVIGGDVYGSDLVVRDNREAGVTGVGKRNGAGKIWLSRSSVTGTRPSSPDELGGIGLQVEGGYALDLVDVVVDDNVLAGVNIYSGTEDGSPALVVDGAVIRGTNAQAGYEEFGFGLILQLGATAEIDGLSVEDNYQYGVALINEGTAATARELSVSGTVANGETGAAIAVQDGAIDCIDCAMSANQGTGVELSLGGSVRLERTVIADTSAYSTTAALGVFANAGEVKIVESDILRTEGVGVLVGETARATLDGVAIGGGRVYDGSGTALLVQDGGSVVGAGLSFAENEQTALRVIGAGAAATMDNVVVTGTVPDADGLAVAVGVVEQGTLAVNDLEISGGTIGLFLENASASVSAAQLTEIGPVVEHTSAISVTAGSLLSLSQVSVSDVEGIAVQVHDSDVELSEIVLEDVRAGAGIFVDAGGSIRGGEVDISAVENFGLSLQAGSQADLTGVSMREGVASEEYGIAVGVIATDGSFVRFSDSTIDGALGDGVLVSGSSAELTGVTISATEPALDWSTGNGFVAMDGAEVALTDCIIEDNVGYGLYVYDGASAVVSDSVVTRTRLPSPPYSRAVGVLVAQEGSRLDATGLEAIGNEGVGALVLLAGEMACSGCSFSDNGHQNVGILAATVRLSDSSVCGGAELGILAGSGEPATVLEVTDSEICGHELAGAYLWGASGQFSFSRVTMTAYDYVDQTAGPWGEALVAIRPAAPYESIGGTTVAGLTVDDCEIAGNGRRPPVFLASAGAAFCGTAIDAGAVEDVRTQSEGEVSSCEDLSIASDKTSAYVFYTVPAYDTPIDVAGD